MVDGHEAAAVRDGVINEGQERCVEGKMPSNSETPEVSVLRAE